MDGAGQMAEHVLQMEIRVKAESCGIPPAILKQLSYYLSNFQGQAEFRPSRQQVSSPTLVKLLHYYFSSAWRALSAAPVSLQNPSQQPTIKDISSKDRLTV